MARDTEQNQVIGEVGSERRVPVYVVFCHGVKHEEQETVLSDGAVITRRFTNETLNVELPVSSIDRVQNDSRVVNVERIK